MARGFQPEITIKEAIEMIDSNKFLLPAIQRKFVWTEDQIELLFDSIMREYPINSLMLWEITSKERKNDYKFYSFLRKYVQRHGEMNEELVTKGRVEDFYAVIDGQQRLNSLYIGLRGTYATKALYKPWEYIEENFPPTKLYLNIKEEYQSETEIDKKYEFKFLKKDKVEKDNQQGIKYWFEVGNILTLGNSIDQLKFLQTLNFDEIDYAQYTLGKLSDVINKDRVLNYFVEDDQDPDKVLDIFIRTNDGGTKLTFSDLLMSVLTANWSDAREKFDELVKEVNEYNDFVITPDFILKTTLVLFSKDIKNRVKNFDEKTLKNIISSWDEIRKTILNCFKMFARLGFDNKTFPAKNAAIPIILWVYDNKLQEDIVKSYFFENTNNSNAKKIQKWLILAFLKRIFGGQPDSVLLEIRRIIKEKKEIDFPLDEIIQSAKKHPTKNYSFDDEFIKDLMETQCGSDVAFYILSLFSPNLDYQNQILHVDHIHPKTKFLNIDNMKKNFSEEEIVQIGNNWNKIGNLQLLNSEKNILKSDQDLKKWMKDKGLSKEFIFIDNDISLEFEDFITFYENRKQNMIVKLTEIVK